MKPTNISDNQDYTISVEVKFDCQNHPPPTFVWEAARIQVFNPSLVNITKYLGVVSNSSYYKIHKGSLPPGTYGVRLNASLIYNGVEIKIPVYGFFTIMFSSLKAVISGGDIVEVTHNTMWILSGNSSYDPQNPANGTKNLQFAWLCKTSTESYSDALTENPWNSTVIVPPTHTRVNQGGCYGTGVGRFNSSDAFVTINTAYLSVGQEYDVTLIVMMENRRGMSTKRIKVVAGEKVVKKYALLVLLIDR